MKLKQFNELEAGLIAGRHKRTLGVDVYGFCYLTRDVANRLYRGSKSFHIKNKLRQGLQDMFRTPDNPSHNRAFWMGDFGKGEHQGLRQNALLLFLEVAREEKLYREW